MFDEWVRPNRSITDSQFNAISVEGSKNVWTFAHGGKT